MDDVGKEKLSANQGRRPWDRPVLRSVGRLDEVLQVGGGKLSAISVDPGEPRKDKGQG
jgi:hypothetical protein